MPGRLYEKLTGIPADELHAQGVADYNAPARDFFPVRHPYGSPDWFAYSGGVVEAYEAEQSEEKARQA